MRQGEQQVGRCRIACETKEQWFWLPRFLPMMPFEEVQEEVFVFRWFVWAHGGPVVCFAACGAGGIPALPRAFLLGCHLGWRGPGMGFGLF